VGVNAARAQWELNGRIEEADQISETGREGGGFDGNPAASLEEQRARRGRRGLMG